MTQRDDFERWITSPPYSKKVIRWPESADCWPSQYRDYEVQLSWDAWQAAVDEAVRLSKKVGDQFYIVEAVGVISVSEVITHNTDITDDDIDLGSGELC